MSVQLECSILGQQVSKSCELLVVACDPRHLLEVCDYDRSERHLWNNLTNYAFHTTLLKVPVSKEQTHAVVFAPGPVELMTGQVYGYRNESAKQFGLARANSMDYNLITVYQLLNEADGVVWTPSQFADVLAATLPTLEWWTYGSEYEIVESVTTPYFNHYSSDNLKDGLPWRLLEIQGLRNTIYVHGSTCFESIFDCWAYGNLILDNLDSVKNALPTNMDSPIIILGAGASGLLFAEKLKRRGYTNIEILEMSDRYGGKTHTIVRDGPYPSGSKEATVCELGACYLSPSYAPMVADLKDYFVGNTQIDFAGADPNFRGIATEGQFPNNKLPNGDTPPTIMPYGDYVLAIAESILGYEYLKKIRTEGALAWELAKYTDLHFRYMGNTSPMPLNEPDANGSEDSYLYRTFGEYMEHHGLKAMKAIMQYGYEVQGYGPLHLIPAYYGLVWITPAITEAILEDQTGLWHKPIVTAWSNGWGDLWSQIVIKNDLQITFNVNTTSIVRGTSDA